MKTILRHFNHSAYCILHCALFMSAASAADMNLAVRGHPAEYTIVIPAAASESQRYAAEELRDFTERVTGVALPIVTDAEPLPEKAILLGETRHTAALLSGQPTVAAGLGEDGFRLVASPPHLLVVASPVRGTLYGVYEILERFAGCRWYASWHSVIPKRDSIAVPDDLDDTQVPAFVMRDPGWYDIRENPEFGARLRVNQLSWKFADRMKVGGSVIRWSRLNLCHTFQHLLPPSEYAETHPEYFALVDGKRQTHSRGACSAEPCLSNPDVLRIVTSNVLEYIRQHPQFPIYGVSQNDDWDAYCRCTNCAAIDEEEGSHSGTVVRFVNAVAEAVEKEFPDKKIETLAYCWSRKPPAKTKLRDNVVVYLCAMGCERSRPFPDARAKESIAFRDDLKGWQSVCKGVAIWDYITNFSHYLSPYPNVYGLFGNIPWYRDVGVKYLFTQADSTGAHGDFSALKAWVSAKLMWNPDLPLGPLLDEFFQGYYGAAAPFVREYFEKLHRLELAFTEEPSHFLGTYPDPVNPALPESFIVEATNLWQKAQEAVNGDMTRTYNVRMGAITMDYMRFVRDKDDVARWQMCLAPQTRSTEKFSEAQMLASRLLDVLETENSIALSEGNPASRVQELRDYLEMAQPPLPVLCGASAVIEEKDIPYAKKLAGVDWGSYVDDPRADDGRALRLITRSSNQGVRYNLRNIEFEDGAKYRIRARVRVDKAGVGVAFHMGILDTPAWPGTTITNIVRRTDEVSGEYEWFDVATYDPAEHSFASFYISSGDYPRGGKSAVWGVYLDKIEVAKAAER